jgi:hypothetical protein
VAAVDCPQGKEQPSDPFSNFASTPCRYLCTLVSLGAGGTWPVYILFIDAPGVATLSFVAISAVLSAEVYAMIHITLRFL